MAIINILSHIDMYGSRFHFTTKKRSKFKTNFGGLLTIITFILIALGTFFFNQNFFYHKNPTVTMSTFPNEYKRINLLKEKLIFPFRIEDEISEPVEFEDIIYIKIYYFSADRNVTSNEYIRQEERYINYHKCTDEEFEIIGEVFKGTYCMDLDKNLTLGGYWDSKFIDYLEIKLYFCPNGSNYSEDNNCTSLSSLNEYLNQNSLKYFSIFYPIYTLDIKNTKNPITKSYKNYFYKLSSSLQKIDRIF